MHSHLLPSSRLALSFVRSENSLAIRSHLGTRPSRPKRKLQEAFTLIELLVVIAILAVLAVVVVLTLNPAGLLQEARDSNRISDMATLNSALGYSLTDNSSESLGSVNTLYSSIPDPTATSTAGDQCQGLGLFSLPAGWSWHCAASSTYRKSDGTGWIPVNLNQLTFGTPLAQLPTDPVQSTSSRLYYTYATNGSQWQLGAQMEASKFSSSETGSGGPDPALFMAGSNLSIAPFAGGMVGWWPLNEGSGTAAVDSSGFGNNGVWGGTASGTGGTYYKGGNNQTYAGYFDGATNFISIPTSSALRPTSTITWSLWLNTTRTNGSTQQPLRGVDKNGGSGTDFGYSITIGNTSGKAGVGLATGGLPSVESAISSNTWTYLTGVYAGGAMNFYINGSSAGSAAASGIPSYGNGGFTIGMTQTSTSLLPFSGLIDDVRIYNRALSSAEIQAIYTAGK